MSALRSAGSVRSLTFLNTLLLASAFALPAFAQIETVVVTAEKRAENLQTVPVSVTAISGDDLKKKQIVTFKDLQYNVPNLTFSKNSLGSGVVTIRGIGQAAGDPGVSQYNNGIYSQDTDLASANYYDLQSIEVLRGPQGTLYGRASVGGLINAQSAVPDLDAFAAKADFTYGEYNTINSSGMVNIPLTDTLGVRLAGDYESHDGFIKNIAPGYQNPDSKNVYSGRGSIRWEPSDRTTIDLSASYTNETDSRDRIDAIMCDRDPTGVIGCLPNALKFQPINSLGNAIGVLDSKQALGQVGAGYALTEAQAFQINLIGTNNTTPGAYSGAFTSTVGGQLCGLAPTGTCGVGIGFGDISAGAYAAASGAVAGGRGALDNAIIFGTLLHGYAAAGSKAGIFDLTQASGQLGSGSSPTLAASMPQSIGVVNNANNSRFDENAFNAAFHLNQKLGSWLTADVLAGYSRGTLDSFGPYSYFPTDNYNDSFYANSFVGNSANNPVTGLTQWAALTGNNASQIGNLLSEYFPGYGTSGPQQFPLSSNLPGGLATATLGKGIQKFVIGNSASDEQLVHTRETSVEMRFSSNLDGPWNFVAGMFYYDRNSYNDSYRVQFNGGDYFAMFVGAEAGPAFGGTQPVIATEPGYKQSLDTTTSSKAVFFDNTYEITDELQLKTGLRWQEDVQKNYFDTFDFSGLNSPSNCGGSVCFVQANPDPAAVVPTASFYDSAATSTQPDVTDRINGRAVLQWMPKLDFTDQSMFYASYARGSKAGNNNLVSGPAAAFVNPHFAPEDVTAYEVGTKNTFFDGTLTANFDAWYYQYENFQYTVVAYSTLFTQNFNAHMWGEEGEFVWQPDEHWAFNLNVTNSDSSIASGQYAVDARNPTAGQTNAVLIKDLSLGAGNTPGQNCVVLTATGKAPADDAQVSAFYALGGQANAFVAPLGGSTALQGTPNSINNIQFANYGTCTANFGSPSDPTSINGYLNAVNATTGVVYYHYSAPTDGPGDSNSGIARKLQGNKVLGLPSNTINVGAQYNFLFDGYTVAPRVDYYWQTGYFSRIFNDNTDAVPSWDQLNLQIQLTAPDNQWFAKVYATNVVGKRNIQGLGPQSDTSGVPTVVEAEDPRIIGFTIGARY